MKGVIFNIFEEFVCTVADEDTWEDILDAVELETKEPFVGPGTYPDGDLMTLFMETLKRLDIEPGPALVAFGKFLFPRLAKAHPDFHEKAAGLKEFLLTIHDVIHVEVRKLYPDAITPQFTYEQPNDNVLIMNYSSQRPLAMLAQGLIEGAAEHFNEAIDLRLQPSADGTSGIFTITFS